MVERKDKFSEHKFFPVFDKYDMKDVKIEDIGLQNYINLEVDKIFLGGIHSNKLFAKSKLPIVERLINNLMRTEHFTGKKTKAYKVVKKAFEIIDARTKTNPLQVFVDALQYAAPIEDSTRLKLGGILVPKSVDVSPQRRLDIALRNICIGAISASHKNRKSIEECLAEEIIKASKNDVSSFAIAKRNELERVARAAR